MSVAIEEELQMEAIVTAIHDTVKAPIYTYLQGGPKKDVWRRSILLEGDYLDVPSANCWVWLVNELDIKIEITGRLMGWRVTPNPQEDSHIRVTKSAQSYADLVANRGINDGPHHHLPMLETMVSELGTPPAILFHELIHTLMAQRATSDTQIDSALQQAFDRLFERVKLYEQQQHYAAAIQEISMFLPLASSLQQPAQFNALYGLIQRLVNSAT
jgi:hypothetical protein